MAALEVIALDTVTPQLRAPAVGDSYTMPRSLAVGGETVTTSNPVLTLTQTWNAGGVTFTGMVFNVTNTASASASKIIDLQVGGVSQLALRKDGALVIPSGRVIVTDGSAGDFYIGDSLGGNGFGLFGNVGFGRSVRLDSAVALAWNSGGPSSGADTGLYRDAAGIIAQRNGANAQEFNLGNTYTDGSNFEYGTFSFKITANVLTIGTRKLGTGASRSVVMVVGGTTVLTLDTANLASFTGPVKTLSTVVASLPAAGTAGSGARAFVTDATATTFLTTVAGGGANKVPVVSDGTNWLIG